MKISGYTLFAQTTLLTTKEVVRIFIIKAFLRWGNLNVQYLQENRIQIDCKPCNFLSLYSDPTKNAAYKNYRNNSANNEFIPLQCLRKEVRDEVDFLHVDNRESFL